MKGFVVAEEGHIVNILPPVDITGGKKSQAFSMANYQHATILLQVGVSAAAFTSIVVQAGSATAAIGSDVTGNTALAFTMYKQETAGADKDVLGAPVAETTSGEASVSANDGIFYVIELDANALPDGKPYVQLVLANGSNSVIASAVAILSGARFSERQSPTVTT
jgi:hypothetical protein